MTVLRSCAKLGRVHPKLKPDLPEAADIDRRHARERNPWRRNRLPAVELAGRGEHTAAQIADLCGIARGHLFLWIKRVPNQGLETLIERGRLGAKSGTRRGLDPAADAVSYLFSKTFLTRRRFRGIRDRFPMRRLISIVLLLCLGVSLPAVGTPLRLCLLENRILLPGFERCVAEDIEAAALDKCCRDCAHGEETRQGEDENGNPSCCVEAGKLPDTTAPLLPGKLPAPVFIALVPPDFLSQDAADFAPVEKALAVSPAIRGPDRPSARCAVLNIWRI